MLRAAVTLASFGMLRSAEYTSPHKCFWDPQGNLNVVDVTTVSPSQIKVRIKCSKSEQFHNGVRIQCPLILICAQFQCYSVVWDRCLSFRRGLSYPPEHGVPSPEGTPLPSKFKYPLLSEK